MKQWNEIFKKKGKVFLKPQEDMLKVAEVFKKNDVKKVLDLGCGTGLLFNQVAEQAKDIIGADLSHKLLVRAKKNAKIFSNVSLTQADADYLPFEEDVFDCVFLFTVLQNMPKPSKTMKEIKRILRRDGNVVVTGLKKVFPLKEFMDILENSSMKITTFIDNENVNCYIAVLEK